MEDITDPYRAASHFLQYDFDTQLTNPPDNAIHIISRYDVKHDQTHLWLYRDNGHEVYHEETSKGRVVKPSSVINTIVTKILVPSRLNESKEQLPVSKEWSAYGRMDNKPQTPWVQLRLRGGTLAVKAIDIAKHQWSTMMKEMLPNIPRYMVMVNNSNDGGDEYSQHAETTLLEYGKPIKQLATATNTHGHETFVVGEFESFQKLIVSGNGGTATAASLDSLSYDSKG